MDRELFQKTISGEKPILVDFFATWCGPCKMMHPILSDLEHEMGDQVYVVKIDIDAQSDLATEYRVQSVPTLMLFKKGELLWRESGAMPLAQLKNKINEALKK